jgi:hypothetical protein
MLLSHLVSAHYSLTAAEERLRPVPGTPRTGWVRRLLAALFSTKR